VWRGKDLHVATGHRIGKSSGKEVFKGVVDVKAVIDRIGCCSMPK
jgi:hypothetical protein